MYARHTRAVTALGLCSVLATMPAAAQEPDGDMDSMMMDMWSWDMGGGWTAMGMAQAFPVVTVGAPFQDEGPFRETGWYITQPAVMANLASAGGGLVLRTTLNFEGLTQNDGELTYGGWGEGFIDKRHPHTLLHEFVLSANFWEVGGGDLSVSAGKGFAPYGTDDPMSRPGLKYPTNHHLSQVLERWFASAAFVRSGWGIETSVFGGSEPEGPYDFGNIDSFGDSWSARASRRWSGMMGEPAWEVSLSHAYVEETHHDEAVQTRLWNGAVRYEGGGPLRYGLLEASTASDSHDNDFFSILGEAKLGLSRHRPYARLEYATRPEYTREPGSVGFYRYDHDEEPIGSTKWLITTLAYEYELTDAPVGLWPFVELQHSKIWEADGGIDPAQLFGANSFWSISIGVRMFLGGDPMRMGAYGLLDPMTPRGAMGTGMGGM